MLLPHEGKVVYINENAIDKIFADQEMRGEVFFGEQKLSFSADFKDEDDENWSYLSSTTLTLLINKDIPTWEKHLNKINDFIDASSRIALQQQLEMFRNNIQLDDKTFLITRGALAMIDHSTILYAGIHNDEPCIVDSNFNETILYSAAEDDRWECSSVNDISLFLANDINFIKTFISDNEKFVDDDAIAAINHQSQCLEDKIAKATIKLPVSLPTKVEEFSL